MSSPDLTGLYTRVPRPVRLEVSRAHLLGVLQDFDGPLLALIAPGGYGKTTLLAQLARALAGRAVWLSLREEDADPLLLCERLVQALTRVLPTLPLNQYVQAATLGKPAITRASALAADLAYSTTNLNFVLDGADHLGDASGQWLGRWLDELPEGHRVLLAARTAPPLSLPRRVASGTALTLHAEALAFTPEETAACLKQLPTSLDASQVHVQLEGWPLGVNLAAGTGGPFTVREVLLEAVTQLPETLRTSLPELAVLDIWTEKQVLDLHLNLPGDWLETLRVAGLPLTPLSGAVRPHALLRELLDELLRRQPERYAELHSKAAQQAEAQGQEWQALEHARRAGDKDTQVRLSRTMALAYQERWESRLVVQVLESLPPALLDTGLKVMLAQAFINIGQVKAGQILLHELQEQGERSAALFFALGKLAARSGADEELLDLAQQGLSCPHTGREKCQLLRLKASALAYLGKLEQAQEAIAQAVTLARESRDFVELLNVLDVVQMIHKFRAEWTECEAALRAALQVHANLDMTLPKLVTQNSLADLLIQRGDYEQALMLLNEALPVAQRERSLVTGLLVETQADLQARLADYARAQTTYELALALFQEFGIEAYITRAWVTLTHLTLLSGEVRDTAPQIASLIAQWELTAPPSSFTQDALSMCRALLAYYTADWQGTLKRAEPLLAGAYVSRAGLLWAHAACQSGNFELPQAQKFQDILAQIRPYHLLPADISALKDIATASARLGVAQPLAEPLLHDLRSRALDPASRMKPAPFNLQIKTLGAVQVSLNAQPLHIPLSRSLEVLVWLALHGQGTRNQIMNDLWDGSNEQRHLEYFKVAVRHLRLALSSGANVTFNPLIYQGGQYRLAPEFNVQVDALRPAQLLNEPTDEGLQQVLDAYGGPFLPESSENWVELRRTELLDQTLSAGLMLAERVQASDPARATALLERCLEIDPLHEDTHLHLIRLWEERSEPQAARRCYARYRRMLSEEWQRTPPADLQWRYESS